MTATNRSPARTMKNSIHLPPIDVMNLNDKLALPPTSFNTFEASPVFRSILHDAPDRHRSHHQPARIACQANRVSLSRSVSPQRRSVSMKTSGKRWERTIPENAGPAPEPVRVDYPNTLEVLARFDNKKVNARLMLDYQTRARASKRAGKAQSEADSKFNIGLLHEANCQWSQAIEAFRRYLEICVERHNQQGKAVACNNVAAIYQKMGDLGTALKYHHMHLECADVQGKFVAHTNLGCVYATLDELQTAMEHHQHALRHAIRMESQTSQAIAINNLGITGGLGGDLYTAKACMERFLELSNDTHNKTAMTIAYAHLADIALMSSEHGEAQVLYRQARQMAQSTGNRQAFLHASIQLGIVIGQLKYDDHMKTIRDRIQNTS